MTTATIFSTVIDALDRLEILISRGRATIRQYPNGAAYLEGRIESIRSRLIPADDEVKPPVRTTLIRGASIATNAAYREVVRVVALDPSVSFASAARKVASVHSQAGTNYGDAIARAALLLAENGEPTDVIILAN